MSEDDRESSSGSESYYEEKQEDREEIESAQDGQEGPPHEIPGPPPPPVPEITPNEVEEIRPWEVPDDFASGDVFQRHGIYGLRKPNLLKAAAAFYSSRMVESAIILSPWLAFTVTPTMLTEKMTTNACTVGLNGFQIVESYLITKIALETRMTSIKLSDAEKEAWYVAHRTWVMQAFGRRFVGLPKDRENPGSVEIGANVFGDLMSIINFASDPEEKKRIEEDPKHLECRGNTIVAYITATVGAFRDWVAATEFYFLKLHLIMAAAMKRKRARRSMTTLLSEPIAKMVDATVGSLTYRTMVQDHPRYFTGPGFINFMDFYLSQDNAKTLHGTRVTICLQMYAMAQRRAMVEKPKDCFGVLEEVFNEFVQEKHPLPPTPPPPPSTPDQPQEVPRDHPLQGPPQEPREMTEVERQVEREMFESMENLGEVVCLDDDDDAPPPLPPPAPSSEEVPQQSVASASSLEEEVIVDQDEEEENRLNSVAFQVAELALGAESDSGDGAGVGETDGSPPVERTEETS
jgi:hypothetical protein